MHFDPNDTHTGIALLFSGFIITMARWLDGEKMTKKQYASRSILNGLWALAAFSITIFYPEADNYSVLGFGIGLLMIGPTTTELLIRRYASKK